MSYKGISVPIPMGQGGLHTDDSPSAIPPTDLILANNVAVYNNLIEKFPGAVKLNATQVAAGVQGMFDFWPDTSLTNRKLVLVAGNGDVMGMDNSGALATIAGGTALTSAVTNQVLMMTGGAEAATRDKKLFIFSGIKPVQVLAGTALTRTDIANPPTDWAGANQPSFGIMFGNRIFAGGLANNLHQIYVSKADDHEDYDPGGTPIVLSVYPGEGQRLIGATIYKGRLFVFKYPFGAYYLQQLDPADPTTWFFVKTENSFGFASAHSVAPVLNDVLIKNASGSITSILATRDFGDIQAGDVLTLLRIENYVRENTVQLADTASHSIYYADRKLAMFSYQSPQGSSHDRLLCFRVDVQGKPKASFVTFANPNCLALRQDTSLVPRPIWGDTEGNIYQMDGPSAAIDGQGYTGEFQTPHIDFGFVDPSLTAKNKNFDFVELRMVPQGSWNIYGDVFIDGKFSETITFALSGDNFLADVTPDPNDFMLSNSPSDPTGSFLSDNNSLQTIRKRLRGTGRTISIRFYNSQPFQTFKIATIIFSFRPSGEQQTH